MSDALCRSNCVFTVAYLDDVILGDTVVTFGDEIKRFQFEVLKFGLTLNAALFLRLSAFN